MLTLGLLCPGHACLRNLHLLGYSHISDATPYPSHNLRFFIWTVHWIWWLLIKNIAMVQMEVVSQHIHKRECHILQQTCLGALWAHILETLTFLKQKCFYIQSVKKFWDHRKINLIFSNHILILFLRGGKKRKRRERREGRGEELRQREVRGDIRLVGFIFGFVFWEKWKKETSSKRLDLVVNESIINKCLNVRSWTFIFLQST